MSGTIPTSATAARKADIPLRELSIDQLYNAHGNVYEIPVYQRNFAWDSTEIVALLHDVYDASSRREGHSVYYIGTLVTSNRGNNVEEVIDGQQRLTAINLVLHALEICPTSKLVYRSRETANTAISGLPSPSVADSDPAILQGFDITKSALENMLSGKEEVDRFANYFLNNVHIIHYQVPRDVDLNHYFEVMNSRGKQLEKHEIVKAKLLEKLSQDTDRKRFAFLWESCSHMSVHIQKKYSQTAGRKIFGAAQDDFVVQCFDSLPMVEEDEYTRGKSIRDLLEDESAIEQPEQVEEPSSDSFQPIINFPNFLLIVLKLTMIHDRESKEGRISLNDKELLAEFDSALNYVAERDEEEEFVKQFGFNLIKAKYLLDNFVVHHSPEEDSAGKNPWKLQYWHKRNTDHELKSLAQDSATQEILVHLLSMFEVCFTPNQRKNYLLYCLLYLFSRQEGERGYQNFKTTSYANFLERMADKFFYDIYLNEKHLNEYGVPVPGAFDEIMLKDGAFDTPVVVKKPDFAEACKAIGDPAKKVPLFIFNYLDYRLWRRYSSELRGTGKRKGGPGRQIFFSTLGCSDFGLEIFSEFYFSRTRRSLEHFFPQANASGTDGLPSSNQVNCFGNYAMIGNEANSSGSNWSPKTKLDHYLDASGKVNLVSVASLKFMIMMQCCKDSESKRKPGHEWLAEDIEAHQANMIRILLDE